MSQLIACKNKKGIVLAVDSKAIDFDNSGQLVEYKVNRLFQLTGSTAIITGGVAAGEIMCRALKDFIEQENLDDVEEVYQAALPFMASEYEQYMRKACQHLPVDPVHQIYFILAGYTETDPVEPFKLYCFWTKKKLPQLDGDEIANAFSIPRLLRLEYKLNQQAQEDRSLEEILPGIRTSLQKQAEIHEEISGPFKFALIDEKGVRLEE